MEENIYTTTEPDDELLMQSIKVDDVNDKDTALWESPFQSQFSVFIVVIIKLLAEDDHDIENHFNRINFTFVPLFAD